MCQRFSHSHVAKPADVLSVGDEVEFKSFLLIQKKERISLSIKANLPGPWTDIEEKAAPGSVLEGTVKRLTSFGAFVEIFPGVEGLSAYLSDLSQTCATPHEVLHEGDQVQVKVLKYILRTIVWLFQLKH